MENLKKFAIECIQKFPHLKERITDLYQLCKDEISEGGSVENEVSICRSSIQDLITEERKL